MSTTRPPLSEDLQEARPASSHQPHEGRRHRARRRPSASATRAPSGCSTPRSPCSVRPQPRPEGRPHVPLRGDGERGDRRGHPGRGPARRGARGAHRPPGRREPAGPCAARSRSRASYPVEKRPRRSPTSPRRRCTSSSASRPAASATSPPGGRGQRAGHERVPVRPGAPPARRPPDDLRAPTASATTTWRASSRSCPSPPTTSAPAAPCYLGAPQDVPDVSTPTCCSRSSRTPCRSEIYELLKRPDEQVRRRPAPTARPRFVEDSRPRDGPRDPRAVPALPDDAFIHAPTRPTSRPSTPTTWRPSARPPSGRSGGSWAAGSTCHGTPPCAPGWTATCPAERPCEARDHRDRHRPAAVGAMPVHVWGPARGGRRAPRERLRRRWGRTAFPSRREVPDARSRPIAPRRRTSVSVIAQRRRRPR